MRTWFNGVSRETLAGDYFPTSELSVESPQQSRAVTSIKEEPFQGYLTLPSDESDMELDMTENKAPYLSPMKIMMRQMQLNTGVLEKEFNNVQ